MLVGKVILKVDSINVQVTPQDLLNTQILHSHHVLRLRQVRTPAISYFHFFFERRTSTGSKFYSLLICTSATKFVLPGAVSGGLPENLGEPA